MRTFKIKPVGKTFVTMCYVDGFHSHDLFSKRKKTAIDKGHDYEFGVIDSSRKYRTEHGKFLDVLDQWDARCEFKYNYKYNNIFMFGGENEVL
tara:strand:+ start:95 stop:373 length:279 start_codon:yes stop_codon:yes gene_type:complete